jgi:catechol 2,3-dioxygenase-like lactoylglutathione lyase family enzyme
MKRPSLDQQVTFLSTADLAATAVFYEQVLGLQLVLDQGACRIFRVSDDAFLGFCSHLTSDEQTQGVILTLVSDEVDAWGDYLRERDIPLEKEPQLNAKFNIYHLFVRDPNGYLVEIQTFRDPAWPRKGGGHG